MPVKIYNTLTRKIEEFVPINGNKVNLFVCGPTVYDYPHMGHGKTYTQFDVLAKFLRYMGYDVFYLQNITDIDDKIINRAKEKEVSWKELAEHYEKVYQEDMDALRNDSVTKYARATDHIADIIKQVEDLLEKGYAYKIEDGIYFETAKFKDYGKLSGRTELREDDSVSRIDEAKGKRGWNDFCLWKKEKPGEPTWDPSTVLGTISPVGKGRPGWHIEDTAITESYFGPQYDLHGGAVDLIFPHHECEIAQMESASGLAPLVKYWMHTGFLNIDSKKMSKSLGNFKTIRDMINSGTSPAAFRLWVLMSHYRSPLNLSAEAIDAAENALMRLEGLYLDLGNEPGSVSTEYQSRFKDLLGDDLDTPRAVALIWELLKDEKISKEDKRATLLDFDKVLSLGLKDLKEIDVPEEIQKLLDERQSARANKDFARSDELRDKILALGYEVKDTDSGQKITLGRRMDTGEAKI